MHYTEAHELGVFESRYHREYALLLAEFEICLEADEVEQRSLAILAPELYHRIRTSARALVGYADWLHRTESHRVLAA